jgi:hypothetical protein
MAEAAGQEGPRDQAGHRGRDSVAAMLIIRHYEPEDDDPIFTQGFVVSFPYQARPEGEWAAVPALVVPPARSTCDGSGFVDCADLSGLGLCPSFDALDAARLGLDASGWCARLEPAYARPPAATL